MVEKGQASNLLESFLFARIFQTFRMAIQPTKLLVAFGAIAIIAFGGWLLDFSRSVVATSDGRNLKTELDVYLANPDGVQLYRESPGPEARRVGVFSTLWRFESRCYHNSLRALFDLRLATVVENIRASVAAVRWALRYHPLYCATFFVIALAVVSLAGGAICRMAALQFAQGERPGLTEAVRFGWKHIRNLFAAPLVPGLLIGIVGLFLFLLGLICNIRWAGELLLSVFMPLALAAGVLLAFVAIGAVAGFNLMFPGVAYDGLDCFDAVSRAFNYLYAKPWHMGFYTAIAGVYGSVCYLFVRLFGFLILWLTHWFVRLGVWVSNSGQQTNKLISIWPEPKLGNLLGYGSEVTRNWSESIASVVVYLFVLMVIGTVVSFIISFYFTANTIIYGLMRHKVDGTALEDIFRFEDVQTEAVNAQNKKSQ